MSETLLLNSPKKAFFSDSCPEDMTYFEKTHSCYGLAHVAADLELLKGKCETMGGGQLASINSKEESDFIHGGNPIQSFLPSPFFDFKLQP